MSKAILAKCGAVAYILWGILHLLSAWSVYVLAQSMPQGVESGRVLQTAWFLMCSSIVAIAVAVTLNWRNSLDGWRINLAVVSIADLGYIFFLLMPGHIAIWPGLAGPVLWIAGLIFSTAALAGRAPKPS